MTQQSDPDPGDAAADLVKLSECARLAGVPTDVLKALAAADMLPGVVRGQRGSVSLPKDQIPTWVQTRDLLLAHRAAVIDAANDALRRVQTELEAVGFDLAEALEHPSNDLGDDLTALDHGRTGSPLQSALFRLTMNAWEVQHVHKLLQRLQAQAVTWSGADDAQGGWSLAVDGAAGTVTGDTCRPNRKVLR
jgi:hypothetical protein